jgi:hypothetical protein
MKYMRLRKELLLNKMNGVWLIRELFDGPRLRCDLFFEALD